MSDILTIDTRANIFTEDEINPLPLYNENHPMLSREIPLYNMPLPNPNMTKLVKQLKMTMKLYGGIGLSANQCGVFERVFVIGTDQFQIACINPRIINHSADVIKTDEGCLSFPGLFVKIERPVSIDVEFVTENGEIKQIKLDGLSARCFAHELDHMNGKNFTEHVGPVALQMARRKQEKIVKKISRLKKNGI
jgi:peptide deformylase